MNHLACVELKNLELQTQIGTYAVNAVVPKKHLLDLTLWINSKWILISEDQMDLVFDYDPLISIIQHLAQECHYETQERLVTRIIESCAKFPVIESMEIGLRKMPVASNSGELGIRVSVDKTTLNNFR